MAMLNTRGPVQLAASITTDGIPSRVLRKMSRYLRAFTRTGIVLDGCQAAGIARSTCEDWRSRYPVFMLAEAEAREAAADDLERHLIRRATRGHPQPIVANGVIIGTRRTPSDNLLMFALKGARPGKYKEKLLDPSDLVTLLQRVQLGIGRMRGTAPDIIDVTPTGTNGEQRPELASLLPAPSNPDPGPDPRPSRNSLLAAVYAGAKRSGRNEKTRRVKARERQLIARGRKALRRP